MDLWNIVKSVGSAALQVALPGTGSLIVGAINAVLPDDKQLPETATGAEVQDALGQIPSEQRAAIMDKQFDVTLEQLKQAGESNRAMLAADAGSTHTTRPYIAKGSFQVVAITTLIAISAWAYGIFTGDDVMIEKVVAGWPFILAVTAPLVALLRAYFGILKSEQADKLNAAQGTPARSGLSGIVSALLKR
jgi:hypothetical protein